MTGEPSVTTFYLAFWVKMTALLLALVFTFTVHRWVAMADETRMSPRLSKLVAWVSLSLWACVGISGHLIGFSATLDRPPSPPVSGPLALWARPPPAEQPPSPGPRLCGNRCVPV